MRTLKINFVDFWPSFSKSDNYFFHLLNSKYDVVVEEENPDLLFFSVDYSKQRQRDRYLNHPCKKIFYSGENVRPNLDFPGSIEHQRYSIGKADFAFTFDSSKDSRQYRLPLWALFINWFELAPSDHRDPSYLIPLPNLINREFSTKEKFCNFVFSNSSGERLRILDAIATYKNVDCAGSLRNNLNFTIPGRGDQEDKILFLKDYKFTIAAENSKSIGYVTEKIIHPLSVGSIPIYWGGSLASEDFNEKCFIDVEKFSTLGDLVEHVRTIDSDKSLYESYLSEPIFKNNEIPLQFRPEYVLKYFEEKILC